MVISSVGPSDSSSYYSGISSSGASTNTPSGSALPTHDSVNLQLDSSLLQPLSQPGASVNGMDVYPTNIQQTVRDQVILATDTNLAQTVSQQASSPLPESQMEALQTVVSRVLCKFITALKPSKEVGSFALSRLGSISNATPF